MRHYARPPVALERLREPDPERLLYGSAELGPALLLTPPQLLNRLAAPVPPPRIHHRRYFGMLA